MNRCEAEAVIKHKVELTFAVSDAEKTDLGYRFTYPVAAALYVYGCAAEEYAKNVA